MKVEDCGSFAQRIAEAADRVREARLVLAFTGAGISTESGLSDFRSPGGLWSRYRPVDYREFLKSGEARRDYWEMRRELIPELLRARPNRAHRALARMEERGFLEGVVTQNIDGLHQAAGSRRVIELHGTNRSASCLQCGAGWPIGEIQKRLEAGERDLRCGRCGGLVKPDTVSFGQELPREVLEEAFDLAGRCDLLLVAGSALEVQPAASLPAAAHAGGARLILVNRTPTDMDRLAKPKFREDAGVVLGDLAAALGCSAD